MEGEVDVLGRSRLWQDPFPFVVLGSKREKGESTEPFPEDYIVLVGDNASWHKSKTLTVPDNINLQFIPPFTPEMNPIEQVWKEIRKRGFKNVRFPSLNKIVDKLMEVIGNLSRETIISITKRDWIPVSF